MRLLKIRRISRSKDDSTALAKQDTKIDAWAEAMGHEVVGDAADSDVSGKTDPFERPELGQWLTDPRKVASFDGIIVSALDRLARSTRYMSKLLDWAEDNGKTVICLEPAIDFSTPVGKLIGFIISWLAEQELALITKRSDDTKRFLIDNGYLVGKPPWTHRVADSGDHKTLEPDPKRAQAIRDVAARYLEGAGLRELGAPLGLGVSSLATLLRNPILIGRRTDANGRTVLRVEPVLDRKTWNQVQAEMDRRATRKGIGAKGNSALLTSIAICWMCKGPMYKHSGRAGALYYRCGGSARQPSQCRNMVRADKVDAEVDAFMLGSFGRNNRITETIVIEGHGFEDQIADIEQDIRELDLDDPRYMEKMGELRAERARLRELPSVPEIVEEWPSDVRIAQHWATLDQVARREYLMQLGMIVMPRKDQDSEITFRDAPREVRIHRIGPGRISIEVVPWETEAPDNDLALEQESD